MLDSLNIRTDTVLLVRKLHMDIVTREDFKSDEEYAFALWCEEAKDNGFISRWLYEPVSYTLCGGIEYEKTVIKKYKRKPDKEVTVWKSLLKEHEYTPDFIIVPTPALDALTHGLIHYSSTNFHGGPEQYVIDTKGTFQRFDGSRTFSINQKWVFSKYRIYINKVVPERFFKKTWVPASIAYGVRGKRLKKYGTCPMIEDCI